jgi:UDP-N-acetylglucosamine 2-epimerase (non-hydrolysing)
MHTSSVLSSVPNDNARILCVIGTRPEAIKMAPVVAALRRQPGLAVRVLLTGQHRRLLDQALAGFGIRADADLEVMRPNQTLSGLTALILTALDPVLERDAPALVLAQGDTTTVMATSVACFHRNVPFGHVEAGLRTGDLRCPFPEEFNRIVAGRVATLNFAPTERARQALLREGIPDSTIHVTGNTVIDALLEVAGRVGKSPIALPAGAWLMLMTMHRRENFGAPAASVLQAVCELCAAFPNLTVVYPVHPNPNIRGPATAALGAHPQVRLTEPLDYEALVYLMRRATLVLTDSGGLQEEAPALGKPVLVLRNETERPEAIELGVARLIGTDQARIVTEVSRLLTDPAAYRKMAKGVSPYGDGRAAERIAAVVARHVGIARPERGCASHALVPQPRHDWLDLPQSA